jgi:hypothetical protein
MVKVSLERNPFSRLSRSSSDNGRTKIGVFMGITVTRQPHTVTRQPKSILTMHYEAADLMTVFGCRM